MDTVTAYLWASSFQHEHFIRLHFFLEAGNRIKWIHATSYERCNCTNSGHRSVSHRLSVNMPPVKSVTNTCWLLKSTITQFPRSSSLKVTYVWKVSVIRCVGRRSTRVVEELSQWSGIPDKKQPIHRQIFWECTKILPVILYGCETWSFTLRVKRRLRVFENRVLRIIFGPKRDEVTGEGRKVHNEELDNLYSSPNIVRVIKSRRMRLAGHVARAGRGKAHTVFWWGNLKERDHLGYSSVDRKIILKWFFRKWNVKVWTGSSWLSIVTSGGLLWLRWWTFGFHKMRGISWLDANRLAIQEGLYSVE